MKSKLIIFGLIILLNSCKTYTITPESFEKQIINVNNNELVDVSNKSYQAINLNYLKVNDKKGKDFELKNSPSIEVRVTLKNGKRKYFYLDTIILENDTLKGAYSKILGFQNKVYYDDVVKIEVQDGKKNFGQDQKIQTKDQVILENSHKTFDNKGEILEYFDFSLDSVSVVGSIFKDVNYAKCKFEKSNTELKIIYYKNKNVLEYISLVEISPQENDFGWYNQFFVENGKIFKHENYILKNENSISQEENLNYKNFKFNKSLTDDFLKKFTLTLYEKIENSDYK